MKSDKNTPGDFKSFDQTDSIADRLKDFKKRSVHDKNNKNNMYQLVYDGGVEYGDDDTGETHSAKPEGLESQEDSNSKDFHRQLSRSQRVAQILGRHVDAWSIGDGDSVHSGIADSDSGAEKIYLSGDFQSCESLEDTFQIQLEHARRATGDLRSLTPIPFDDSRRRPFGFEDNADFSSYGKSFLHSTPIRRPEEVTLPSHNPENRAATEVSETDDNNYNIRNTNIFTETIDYLNRNANLNNSSTEEKHIINTEDTGGLVRILRSSTRDESDLVAPKNKLGSLSPTSPKTPSQSLAARLKRTLSRPLSPNRKSTGNSPMDMAIKFSGPPRFEFDSGDCFIDDDVTYLCNNNYDDGPDPNDAKIFRGFLQPEVAPGCDDRTDQGRVLSDQVQLNEDDDYENALSQDPSSDVIINHWNRQESEISSHSFLPAYSFPLQGRPNFSKFFKSWVQQHKKHLMIFSLLIGVLFVTVLVVLCNSMSQSLPAEEMTTSLPLENTSDPLWTTSFTTSSPTTTNTSAI